MIAHSAHGFASENWSICRGAAHREPPSIDESFRLSCRRSATGLHRAAEACRTCRSWYGPRSPCHPDSKGLVLLGHGLTPIAFEFGCRHQVPGVPVRPLPKDSKEPGSVGPVIISEMVAATCQYLGHRQHRISSQSRRWLLSGAVSVAEVVGRTGDRLDRSYEQIGPEGLGWLGRKGALGHISRRFRWPQRSLPDSTFDPPAVTAGLLILK